MNPLNCELSIGNYVNIEQTTYRVVEIRDDRIAAVWISGGSAEITSDWLPIKLTRETLTNLGFEEAGFSSLLDGSNKRIVWGIDLQFTALREIEGNFFYHDVNIEYVHQLQNIHYLETKTHLKWI